ncbi:hypothetical protein JFV28_01200 [Pseudomonas sp. TH05]|uniref:hypothetical protein n=1 Tax=unclassified Pseudomonas TaxID=196821 RepID=UPI0019114C23|nr:MULTISPECIES: hypothetical protein [unclassified Pseudomonas]MBK5542561.1 hypothetical protein [Pseudomonas sp. TH07]MBK5554481.1 hypothetical protein [Pseudomonas sp. TH05]
MNIKMFISIAFFTLLLGGEVRAYAALVPTGDEAELCADSLRRNATIANDDGFSISTFRLFKSYPPLGSQSESDDSDREGSYKITNALPLSIHCLSSKMYEFKVRGEVGLKEGVNKDLKPISVRLLGGSYYVVFIRDGYFVGDGEGRELVASIAVYNSAGELVRKMDRISSWRDYEGSLVLLEACVAGNGMLLRELNIDPNVRSKVGDIISYSTPILLLDQVLYPVGGGYSLQGDGGGVKCDWSNYLIR